MTQNDQDQEMLSFPKNYSSDFQRISWTTALDIAEINALLQDWGVMKGHSR